MSAAPAARLQVVIYEGAGSQPLDGSSRAELFRTLLEKGYAVASVRRDKAAKIPDDARTLVLGCFTAPPSGSQEQESQKQGMTLRDINGLGSGEILNLVDQVREDAAFPAPGKWKPWFPVIDYKRCTNCMQCLSFCLFDVYGVDADGKIQVRNQDNCKTDCPACSRVCPEVAILFPKYRHGPIHGGEINSDDLRRESMKVDISALLGGDIYSALRDRSAKAKSRFSKERDEDRALQERLNCLKKIQKEMDIAGEVLAALPSVDEIRVKAEAAKARAEAALANSAQAAPSESVVREFPESRSDS
ncbi:MAG: 4Fe-4S dicluster domain-containing protein [Bryobacteraceae bacterium]